MPTTLTVRSAAVVTKYWRSLQCCELPLDSLYHKEEADTVASPASSEGTYQLCAHTVCSLERPLVQEVVIAPVSTFLVLLVRMVHIQESEMITCSSQSACNMVQGQAQLARQGKTTPLGFVNASRTLHAILGMHATHFWHEKKLVQDPYHQYE